LTTARLLSRDGLSLKVRGLDVIDGTPVIDIKPFYPPYDVPDTAVRVPGYVYRLAY
jgi:tRNA (adenine37-N6)-methyltransferase